jgi:hypothetical protein
MIDLGFVFFCLGWTGSVASTWERTLWAVLTLIFGLRIWQDGKLTKA